MKLGTDIIEIQRIRDAMEKSESFKNRVYTESEILYCESRRKSKYHSYAGIYAAKEALLKALGTGMRYGTWQDIEITRDALGAPIATVKGSFLDIMDQNQLLGITLSISHCQDYAVSTVLIEE